MKFLTLIISDLFPAVFWFWIITNQICWPRFVMFQLFWKQCHYNCPTEKSSVYTTSKPVSHMDSMYSWAKNSNPENLVEIQRYDGQQQLYHIGEQIPLVSCVCINKTIKEGINTLGPLAGCHSSTENILEICINPMSAQSVHLQQPTVFFFF